MTTAIIYFTLIDSPLGELCVHGDGCFLTGLFMPQHSGWSGPDPSWQQNDSQFATVREQLGEYFGREREQFDVPIKLAGTPFQRQVWQELVGIPFGTTITYAELANRVGNPAAARAVGNANARNPISIIVPCHRVIGANGSLTGYAGSLSRKQWLLEHESRRRETSKNSATFDLASIER